LLAYVSGPPIAPQSFFAFFFIIFILGAIGFAFWLWGLIDACTQSEDSYNKIGSSKTMWVVLIAVLGFIPAIIYLASVRSRLKAVAITWSPGSRGPRTNYYGRTVQTPNLSTSKFCTNCGGELISNTSFCPSCGRQR
jgi:hypothetical protein